MYILHIYVCICACIYTHALYTHTYILCYIFYIIERHYHLGDVRKHLPQRKNQRRAKIKMQTKSCLLNQGIYCAYLQGDR